MKDPIVSISGVRGIVGESLFPENYLQYALAFGTMLNGGKVVVGSDTRRSRELLRHTVFSALISCGCEVIDIGIVPTPTVALIVKELRASGGIAITASHNPKQWNAFKFFSSKGEFLTKPELAALLDIYSKGNFKRAAIDEIGSVKKYENAIQRHIQRVLNFINVSFIRSKRIKVVVDCCNGAGFEIIPQLLDELDCEKIILNANENEDFPHPPEPLPENLYELAQAVKDHKADIGFAVDPDSDRLVIIDENGICLSEERTITLAAEYLSPRLQSPIVVNLSTTRAIDDIAQRHNLSVFRTPIGESNVIQKMNEVHSRIGGEGNGGVIIPDIHGGRDAIAGIGIFLDMLANTGVSISEYNKTIPQYFMRKDKIPIGEKVITYEVFERYFTSKYGEPENRSTDDGLKLIYKNFWIHIRPSGTEPIIRVIAEADSKLTLEEVVEYARTAR